MAQPVIWSEESLDDIDGLAEYISRDSFYYAQHVADEIMAAGHSLQENPTRGRIVPELNNPSIRELFIYSYRLIYQLKEEETEVLAVIHGQRLLESDERFGEEYE
jgi:plasmid stabilization system protein ParE